MVNCSVLQLEIALLRLGGISSQQLLQAQHDKVALTMPLYGLPDALTKMLDRCPCTAHLSTHSVVLLCSGVYAVCCA